MVDVGPPTDNSVSIFTGYPCVRRSAATGSKVLPWCQAPGIRRMVGFGRDIFCVLRVVDGMRRREVAKSGQMRHKRRSAPYTMMETDCYL